MGRCKDCQHWRTGAAAHQEARDLGTEWYPVKGGGTGLCALLSSDKHGHDRDRKFGRLAFAICTSEGIGAEFITAPDFGCVHHAPIGGG